MSELARYREVFGPEKSDAELEDVRQTFKGLARIALEIAVKELTEKRDREREERPN